MLALTNGRSSSGPRKFKLNLRILKRIFGELNGEKIEKTNLFFMAELRDDLSLFALRSDVDGSLSFVFEIDFHRNVFPTSSEKLITPVDVLI